MALPTLQNDGDAVEKATWPSLRDFFPHYETFWQTHIVPLRSTNSIHPRRGIDEDFEFLAMQHYSIYVNLGNAYERVFGRGQEEHTNFRFPDEIYATLHRAAELAIKVVDRFKHIFETCLNRKPKVDTSRIESLMERIVSYRNLIHQEFPAIRIDADGRLQIPRPEKLSVYRKWTDVLYESRAEDFVEMGIQLVDDFRALCSALETSWKTMCELSGQLVTNQEYLRKRSKGDSVPVVSVTAPPVSGAFESTSTSTASNVFSTRAVSAVVIRKPRK